MSHDPFHRLDRIDPPDQWAAIADRVERADAGELDVDLAPARPPRRRAVGVIAAAAAVVVLLGGAVVASHATGRQDEVATATTEEPTGPAGDGPICPFHLDPSAPGTLDDGVVDAPTPSLGSYATSRQGTVDGRTMVVTVGVAGSDAELSDGVSSGSVDGVQTHAWVHRSAVLDPSQHHAGDVDPRCTAAEVRIDARGLVTEGNAEPPFEHGIGAVQSAAEAVFAAIRLDEPPAPSDDGVGGRCPFSIDPASGLPPVTPGSGPIAVPRVAVEGDVESVISHGTVIVDGRVVVVGSMGWPLGSPDVVETVQTTPTPGGTAVTHVLLREATGCPVVFATTTVEHAPAEVPSDVPADAVDLGEVAPLLDRVLAAVRISSPDDVLEDADGESAGPAPTDPAATHPAAADTSTTTTPIAAPEAATPEAPTQPVAPDERSDAPQSWEHTLPDGRVYRVETGGGLIKGDVDGRQVGSSPIAQMDPAGGYGFEVTPNPDGGPQDWVIVGARPAGTVRTVVIGPEGEAASPTLTVSPDGAFWAIHGFDPSLAFLAEDPGPWPIVHLGADGEVIATGFGSDG